MDFLVAILKKMKGTASTLLTLFWVFLINSQNTVPITYQAVVRNLDGTPVISMNVIYRFNIIKGSVVGKSVYSETQNVMTDHFGLVSLIIGKGNQVSGDFTKIEWDDDNYFIKVERAFTSNSKFIDMGTIQMLKAPVSSKSENTGKQLVGVPNLQTDHINSDPLMSVSKDKLRDYDGNEYETIKIGTRVWLATNLKVTHYSNGDSITNIHENKAWCKQSSGAYCIYGNSSDNSHAYGMLYNWYAVTDSRSLCPADWHVSNDADWAEIEKLLGGESIAGQKLKARILPLDGISGQIQTDGFYARMGGGRNSDSGEFCDLGISGGWWGTGSDLKRKGSDRGIDNDNNSIYKFKAFEQDGFSVRCVKN
jgi:uncharacterized protein (TIGR02145 family)